MVVTKSGCFVRKKTHFSSLLKTPCWNTLKTKTWNTKFCAKIFTNCYQRFASKIGKFKFQFLLEEKRSQNPQVFWYFRLKKVNKYSTKIRTIPKLELEPDDFFANPVDNFPCFHTGFEKILKGRSGNPVIRFQLYPKLQVLWITKSWKKHIFMLYKT